MTAEVAVLNKMAVALAADSAVTFGRGPEQKIYNTGNKLFTLSKYYPVGIMVYGNAELMGVPWETIVKYYRSKLAHNKFDSLIEYAQHFIRFLETENSVLWTPNEQQNFFRGSVVSFLEYLARRINEDVESSFKDSGGSIPTQDIVQRISEIIGRDYRKWHEAEPLFPDADEVMQRILTDQAQVIEELKREVLQQLPISEESSEQISQICGMLFCKKRFPDSISGVVIGGMSSFV